MVAGDDPPDETHLMELDRIRKIYVPEMVIKLNLQLYAYSKQIPWCVYGNLVARLSSSLTCPMELVGVHLQEP